MKGKWVNRLIAYIVSTTLILGFLYVPRVDSYADGEFPCVKSITLDSGSGAIVRGDDAKVRFKIELEGDAPVNDVGISYYLVDGFSACLYSYSANSGELSNPYSRTVYIDIPIDVSFLSGKYLVSSITICNTNGEYKYYGTEGYEVDVSESSCTGKAGVYVPERRIFVPSTLKNENIDSGELETLDGLIFDVVPDGVSTETPTLNSVDITEGTINIPSVAHANIKVDGNVTLAQVYYAYQDGTTLGQFSTLEQYSGEAKNGDITIDSNFNLGMGVGDYKIIGVILQNDAGNVSQYSVLDEGYVAPTIAVTDADVYNYKYALSANNLVSRIESIEPEELVYVGIEIGDSEKKMPKGVLNAIKGKNIEVVAYDDNMQWRFNGNNISDEVDDDIDMTLDISQEKATEYYKSDDIVNVSFGSSVDFPCTTEIRVKSEYLYEKYGESQNLYFYRKTDDGLQNDIWPNMRMHDDGTNKWCGLELNKGDNYVISPVDLSYQESEIEDDPTADVTGPKLTSVSVESNTVNRPGTIKVKLGVHDDNHGITYARVALSRIRYGEYGDESMYAEQTYAGVTDGEISIELPVGDNTRLGTYIIQEIRLENSVNDSNWYYTDQNRDITNIESNDPRIDSNQGIYLSEYKKYIPSILRVNTNRSLDVAAPVIKVIDGEKTEEAEPRVTAVKIKEATVEKPGSARLEIDYEPGAYPIKDILVNFVCLSDKIDSEGDFILPSGSYNSYEAQYNEEPMPDGKIYIDIPVSLSKSAVYQVSDIGVYDTAETCIGYHFVGTQSDIDEDDPRIDKDKGTYNPVTRDYYPNYVVGPAGDVVKVPSLTVTGEDITFSKPKLKSIKLLADSVIRPGVAKFEVEVEKGSVDISSIQVNLGYLEENKMYDQVLYTYCWGNEIVDGKATISLPLDANTKLGHYRVNSIYIQDDNSFVSYSTDYENPTYLYGMSDDFYGLAPEFTVIDVDEYSQRLDLSHPNLVQRLTDSEEGKVIGLFIDNKSEGIMPKAAFDAIKGRNIAVVVYKDEYQWIFRGEDITNSTKDVNLLMNVTKVDESEYDTGEDAVKIEFQPNGLLPGKAEIRIKSDYLYDLKGIKGKLYLYYDNNGTLELQQDSNIDLTFDGTDKWCNFNITHNSTYIVSGSEIGSKTHNGSDGKGGAVTPGGSSDIPGENNVTPSNDKSGTNGGTNNDSDNGTNVPGGSGGSSDSVDNGNNSDAPNGLDKPSDIGNNDSSDSGEVSGDNSGTSVEDSSGASSGDSSGGGPTYSSEWVDGKWYNADGSQTYAGTMTWKCNSIGWWIEDSLNWYPTSCWQKIDGYWYYFNSSGYMASSEWVGGYWVSSNGTCTYGETASWKEDTVGWYYIDTSGWYPHSQWQKIDGNWYYFNSSGYMVTNTRIDGYWIGANGVCQ